MGIRKPVISRKERIRMQVDLQTVASSQKQINKDVTLGHQDKIQCLLNSHCHPRWDYQLMSFRNRE
jgi:hypothetical protein